MLLTFAYLADSPDVPHRKLLMPMPREVRRRWGCLPSCQPSWLRTSANAACHVVLSACAQVRAVAEQMGEALRALGLVLDGDLPVER